MDIEILSTRETAQNSGFLGYQNKQCTSKYQSPKAACLIFMTFHTNVNPITMTLKENLTLC